MRLVLRNAILKAGTTQRSLAHSIGLRESRLSEIIRGWIDPEPEERRAIAAALRRTEHGLFRNIELDVIEHDDAVA